MFKKITLMMLSLLFLQNTNSFLISTLPKRLKSKLDKFVETNTEIKILEPIYNENNKTVIFFPAKSGSTLPYQVYNNFLNSIMLKNIKVLIPNPLTDLNLINSDIINYPDITLIAHSTAAVSAIKYTNMNSFIKNLVLIDPLDTRKLEQTSLVETDFNIEDINSVNEKQTDNLVLNNIDRLTIFKSKKSESWKLTPPFIPISFFNLKVSDINMEKNINRTTEIINSFGHFDIMDREWSNLAHNLISRGNGDRSSERMQQYHMWLANKIYNMTESD